MAKRLKKPKLFLDFREVGRILGRAKSFRDRLLILIGLFSGLRVSELVCLTTDDVDLGRKTLRVLHGKGDKLRYVPIHDRLVEPLRLYLEGHSRGWLFPSKRCAGQHLSARAMRHLLRTAGRKAGVKRQGGQAVHPHALRRYFASRLIETGSDVVELQKLMGHADLSSAMAYLDAFPERLRGAIDRL